MHIIVSPNSWHLFLSYLVEAVKDRISDEADVCNSSEICSRYRRTLTEAFTLVGRPVDEDFGGDDVAKGEEHLHELAVTELLGQVVDEQVAALGSWDRASYHINQSTSKHLNLKYNTQVRMLVLDEFCSS